MSILIKGMGIPKNCWKCPCDYGDFGECVCGLTEKSTREFREKRRDDCPIFLRVPAPHGRLIDADKMKEQLENSLAITLPQIPVEYRKVFGSVLDAYIRFIDDVPTVIPAEDG